MAAVAADAVAAGEVASIDGSGVEALACSARMASVALEEEQAVSGRGPAKPMGPVCRVWTVGIQRGVAGLGEDRGGRAHCTGVAVAVAVAVALSGLEALSQRQLAEAQESRTE